ncbi:MAG: Trk system potassium transporter TrkA [Gammaproteobacteria bacterium]|nr:MAG: Trk system potassium transporter TrkA [Gammaproteobacteria bacterium]
MKIIILGAGQVGRSVAYNLINESNEITVVDMDSDVLQDLKDRLDIQTVQGNATHPDILMQAGVDDADMLIAVTDTDEVNMVACQVAYTLFRTPTKIARVRSVEYLRYPELFSSEALPIDVLISPEQLVTQYIQRLIENPGALQVLDFAGGKVRLVGVKVYYGGLLVGKTLSEIQKYIPEVELRVAAIFRRGKPVIPTGDTTIEADDELFLISARENIPAIIKELRPLDKPAKRIIIAGGGSIGKRLAIALESKYSVKIIERDEPRTHEISEVLNKTLVLKGDAADEDLLQEENVEETDLFIGVTNDDEANILSAMLAKRMGAKRVMSLINRPAYVDLVQAGEEIDIAISPQQTTIGTLLAHVRLGDVVMVHSLRRGAAEAIEAVAHGDPSSSKVVGRTVGEIKLPKGTTIGAIVRENEVLMAHHDVVIKSDDHVILFLVDKKRIPEVEKLFQVGLVFF